MSTPSVATAAARPFGTDWNPRLDLLPTIVTPIGDSFAWMNGTIEADICGNVDSTHLMGSRIQNGNGDCARKAYVSMFLTPSAAKGGAIDLLHRADSHVEHTGILLIMMARVAGR